MQREDGAHLEQVVQFDGSVHRGVVVAARVEGDLGHRDFMRMDALKRRHNLTCDISAPGINIDEQKLNYK